MGATYSTSNTKLKPNTSQFQLKLEELRFAWKNTYGTDQPFPAEYIHFADRSKAKLPPAQHEAVVQPVQLNQHKGCGLDARGSFLHNFAISSVRFQ